VPVSLYDYFGEIIVLNFFTTWCPGCNEEAEGLENNIWQVYRERGLSVIAVDIAEPPILVAGWAAANEVTYQILIAPDWELYSDYGPGIIPFNAVLDRTMTLRYSQIGYDEVAIIQTIEAILAEDSTATEAIGSWGQLKALYD
jgi:peroxiredoxin